MDHIFSARDAELGKTVVGCSLTGTVGSQILGGMETKGTLYYVNTKHGFPEPPGVFKNNYLKQDKKLAELINDKSIETLPLKSYVRNPKFPCDPSLRTKAATNVVQYLSKERREQMMDFFTTSKTVRKPAFSIDGVMPETGAVHQFEMFVRPDVTMSFSVQNKINSGGCTGHVLFRTRVNAPLRRLYVNTFIPTQERFSHSRMTNQFFVQGRFDIITLEDAIAAGSLMEHDKFASSYNREYTKAFILEQILEPEVRLEDIIRVRTVIDDQGEAKTVKRLAAPKKRISLD